MRAASNPVSYSYVNVNMCNYPLTIFPTPLSLSLFKHSSPSLLPQLKYGVSATLTLSDCSARQTGCKFIKFFGGLCSAGAWHALCLWIGESVFVPDGELEIRGRHFCTCIPFTSHLVSSLSHYNSPFLSLHYSDALFLFACTKLRLKNYYYYHLCRQKSYMSESQNWSVICMSITTPLFYTFRMNASVMPDSLWSYVDQWTQDIDTAGQN